MEELIGESSKYAPRDPTQADYIKGVYNDPNVIVVKDWSTVIMRKMIQDEKDARTHNSLSQKYVCLRQLENKGHRPEALDCPGKS